MKKCVFALATLMFSVLFMSCGSSGTCIDGSGEISSESRNVTYFESINLRTAGNVFISQGNENSVKIESNKDILPQLITKVEDETLLIDCEKAICPAKLNIYVTVKDLNSVQLSGSGNIFNFTPIRTDELFIKSIGSGNVNITEVNCSKLGIVSGGSGNVSVDGNTNASVVEVNGSGNVNTLDLTNDYMSVTLNSSGEAKAKVGSKVIANVNGSGDFKYIGEPIEKKFQRTGSGNIKKIKAVS